MTKRINLFYLTDNVKFGGFPTYTAHLYRGLRQFGYDPVIWKISPSDRNTKLHFTHGLHARPVSMETALKKVSAEPSLIVTCYWRRMGHKIADILYAGAGIVLHDHSGGDRGEFHTELLENIRAIGRKVVLIREANLAYAEKRDLDCVFIPHPYVRVGPIAVPRRYHAVAISRIDFDKHQEIIAEANDGLPVHRRCVIYGSMNRMYAFHKLDKDWPKWRNAYLGEFPSGADAAVKLVAKASWMVDMSVIPGDGGGTQYTFLEAFDAETPCILNARWRSDAAHVKNELEGAVLYVEDAAELRDLLRSEPRDLGPQRRRMAEILANHAPEKTIPPMLEYLGA